jgi:hypothetical protein
LLCVTCHSSAVKVPPAFADAITTETVVSVCAPGRPVIRAVGRGSLPAVTRRRSIAGTPHPVKRLPCGSRAGVVRESCGRTAVSRVGCNSDCCGCNRAL